jgi:hypothetical protein
VLSATDGKKQTKSETLKAAGIKERTAYNYEELAGPREDQAEEAVAAASDHYFASASAVDDGLRIPAELGHGSLPSPEERFLGVEGSSVAV